MNRNRQEKGITLIALVITIIILLILAGISISALTESGLFVKAKNAKEQYSKAEAMEKVQLEVLASYDEKGALDLGKLKENINANLKDAKITETEAGKFPITVEVDGEKFEVKSNGEVSHIGKGTTGGSGTEDPIAPGDDNPLVSELRPELKDKLKEEVKKIQNLDITETNPIKAMPSETTEILDGNVNNGIVIKDSENNEWVWVEVPYAVTEKVTSDGDIETALQGYATDYREGKKGQDCNWTDEWYDGNGKNKSTTTNENDTSGCGLTYKQYSQNKSKMLQSIKTNGGFWIGRYESGIKDSDINTNLARTSHTDITNTSVKAVSKPDHLPYNWVYCREAQKLASEMYTGTDKTSSLMYGIQWDLVCKFLEEKGDFDRTTHTAQYYIKENSTDWGNYRNKALNVTSLNAKQSSNGKSWSTITETKALDSSRLLSTGASIDTRNMNIYDFAGSEKEWTLEKYYYDCTSCVCRGGQYSGVGSAECASFTESYGTSDWGRYGGITFRTALY